MVGFGGAQLAMSESESTPTRHVIHLFDIPLPRHLPGKHDLPAPTADLTLTHLRCFLAVAAAGSFAEAGRRLGLSTSAVSKVIGRFESSSGGKLLHRSTHSLSL